MVAWATALALGLVDGNPPQEANQTSNGDSNAVVDTNKLRAALVAAACSWKSRPRG
jgi:hypothetical protein